MENIIYLFSKTNYLNEEVKCTEPSPQTVIPYLKASFGFRRKVTSRSARTSVGNLNYKAGAFHG
jgi:hypothetical protein